MKTILKNHTGRSFCILACMILFCAFSSLGAQGVNKTELESVVTNPDTISFVNYTGPHAVISTAAQIRGIGVDMAKPVSDDTGRSIQSGEAARYLTYHVIGAADGTKLDADILVLGKNASVDHIKNLRRIIAGYLTTAYGYTAEDADTLAVFITVYNAVNRGKTASFEQRYKKEVCALLTPESCGLSVNWEDWAGKTQIVIPLLDPVDGGLSTIDTTSISGKDVVESLREGDERGVEDRKKLVDLKEREADAAYEAAKEAQSESVLAAEEARQAEREVAVNRQALVEARDAERLALAEYDEAEPKKADEARKKATEASKAADEAQKEYEASKDKAAAAKEKSAEKAAEATERQQFADKKNAETQGERIAIAQDQQKNIQEAAEAKRMKTTYALLFDGKSETSSLILVNAETGAVVKKSAVTDIRSKCVYPVDGGYIAVAGRNDKKNTAVKLVIIDMDTMELISQSHEDMSADSALVQYKNRYYGILKDGKKAYVGCWDDSLTLVSQSEITVLEKTPLLITDKGVTVTTDKGAVALLTVDTLDQIK